MTGATISILGILCCLIIVFLRSGHADYALSVLPILLVPAAYLIAIPFADWLFAADNISPAFVRTVITVGGFILFVILLTLFSRRIKAHKNRSLYWGLCFLYCTVLLGIYLYHLSLLV